MLCTVSLFLFDLQALEKLKLQPLLHGRGRWNCSSLIITVRQDAHENSGCWYEPLKWIRCNDAACTFEKSFKTTIFYNAQCFYIFCSCLYLWNRTSVLVMEEMFFLVFCVHVSCWEVFFFRDMSWERPKSKLIKRRGIASLVYRSCIMLKSVSLWVLDHTKNVL